MRRLDRRAAIQQNPKFAQGKFNIFKTQKKISPQTRLLPPHKY